MLPLRSAVLALSTLATLATAAQAQILRGGRPDTTIMVEGPRRDSSHRSDFQNRSSGGFGMTQTRPQGGLAHNISFGYGGSGNYVYRLDRAGVVGMRVAMSLSGYDQERITVPLSYTIGGRVQADVTTTNMIGTVSVGPQLMFPEGYVRPYMNAGVGLMWFETNSSVSGLDDYDGAFNTRNYSDGTPTWMAGAGIRVPVSARSVGVLIDLGFDYFTGGEASYLRKGSIVDLPGGQIQINSFRSDTPIMNVTLGVTITP